MQPKTMQPEQIKLFLLSHNIQAHSSTYRQNSL